MKCKVCGAEYYIVDGFWESLCYVCDQWQNITSRNFFFRQLEKRFPREVMPDQEIELFDFDSHGLLSLPSG